MSRRSRGWTGRFGWPTQKRTCAVSGKVVFDKLGARTAANRRWDEDHEDLDIYCCPYCGGWHLTSRTGKWERRR